MYDLTAMTTRANRMTYAKAKAMAMGFVFGPTRVREDGLVLLMEGHFNCLCGRTEHYRLHMGYVQSKMSVDQMDLDPAEELRRHGSFSREHLLADGYSPKQVEEILERGRDFDRGVELGRENHEIVQWLKIRDPGFARMYETVVHQIEQERRAMAARYRG